MGLNTLTLLANSSDPSTGWLVSVLVAAIVIILVLILKFRVQAFVSLLLAAIFVGLASRTLGLTEVADTIVSGMGGALGFIAIIIGLGAIFGQMIEHSGGAQSLANGMLKAFGEKRANWAMLLTGFLISIPVFLDVGVVILAPIIYALARKSGRSVLLYALPLLAGMAVTHAFVPPTPGPTYVAFALGAPLGYAILWGVAVGLPTALITIPVCRWLGERFYIEPPAVEEQPDTASGSPGLPSMGAILAILGIPILMIVVASFVESSISAGTDEFLKSEEAGKMIAVEERKKFSEEELVGGRELTKRETYKLVLPALKKEAGLLSQIILFLGHPVIALLGATCMALYFLGSRRGVKGKALMEVATKALGPAGIIILVTGAGGVFKQMLVKTEVGKALAEVLSQHEMPVLLLAWILTTIVRIAQGSATVAMVTGAALIGPILEALVVESGVEYSVGQLCLITLTIAAGATGFGHVNDSGFWIVNRYFHMTERETLLTWTPILTVISLVGLGITSLLWMVV